MSARSEFRGCKITVRDHGLNDLVRRIDPYAKGVRLTVGIHKDTGTHPDGTEIRRIAAAHEFGEGVPQRSFIRGWFDGRKDKFRGELLALAQVPFKSDAGPDEPVKDLGRKYVDQIQQRIEKGISPPLSPKTIDSKTRSGSATPTTALMDTHTLFKSIGFLVRSIRAKAK